MRAINDRPQDTYEMTESIIGVGTGMSNCWNKINIYTINVGKIENE